MLIVSTIVLTILVFAIPFALNRVTNFRKSDILNRLVLAFVVGVIIFLTLGFRSYNDEPSFNLRLFRCYRGLANQISYKWRTFGLKYDSEQFKIISTGICNIVANLALFVPIGCLLPKVFHKQNFTLGKIFLIGIGLSLIIEATQLITHRGCFDLDDLFHNSIGTMLGFVFGKHVSQCMSNSETNS